MSVAHQGQSFSPDRRANMGHPMTEQNRVALSLRMQGNQYNRGNHHSLETRAKMSASHIGLPFSLARRVALSDSHFIHLTDDGYANAKFLGRWVSTLRLAYTYYHGPIPKGKLICPRNGDQLDCSKENLEAMTKREHFSSHVYRPIERMAA